MNEPFIVRFPKRNYRSTWVSSSSLTVYAGEQRKALLGALMEPFISEAPRIHHAYKETERKVIVQKTLRNNVLAGPT